MADTLRLELPREVDGDRVEYAATLDLAGKSQRLWWRVPAAWRDAITPWADPFVIGFVFPIMQAGGEVEVVGRVSPSLLANLESFMTVWQTWMPARYRSSRIWSREEIELPLPAEPDAVVVPFSSGVDSCFTALRHARGLAGRNTRRVIAGVTMFGFDILADQKNVPARYAQLREGAAAMLESLDIAHVEIDSNFRTLDQTWRDSHATQLASGLSLFGRRAGGALIPNSVPVNHLATLWASHPLTDPMLSSGRFRIRDDGGTQTRPQKVATLVGWPEAMAGLRVCFGEAANVGNCGRCEKCIRTAIAFKVAGATPPAGLPDVVTPRMLRRIALKSDIALEYWHDLHAEISERGQTREPWAANVRLMLRRAARQRVGKALRRPFLPFRSRVRKWLRGSELSKRQLAALAAADRAASTRS